MRNDNEFFKFYSGSIHRCGTGKHRRTVIGGALRRTDSVVLGEYLSGSPVAGIPSRDRPGLDVVDFVRGEPASMDATDIRVLIRLIDRLLG